MVITTRLWNWSAADQPLDVDLLSPEAATAFLLERTAERRRKADDDATTAAVIAVEDLGRLALALEQAGAYISRRLTLPAYRSEWQRNRDQVLSWCPEGLDLNGLLIAYALSIFTMLVRGHPLRRWGVHDGDLLLIDRAIEPRAL